MNMAGRMDCILMRNEDEKDLLLPFQILQKKKKRQTGFMIHERSANFQQNYSDEEI